MSMGILSGMTRAAGTPKRMAVLLCNVFVFLNDLIIQFVDLFFHILSVKQAMEKYKVELILFQMSQLLNQLTLLLL
jgi:hypothetical protein